MVIEEMSTLRIAVRYEEKSTQRGKRGDVDRDFRVVNIIYN